jgi:hypothetical protein
MILNAHILYHYNDKYETVDLKAAIQNHLELMCGTYVEIVKKMVLTIYKSNKCKRNELLKRVAPFEQMLSGCGLMKNQQTGEFIVIKYVSAK